MRAWVLRFAVLALLLPLACETGYGFGWARERPLRTPLVWRATVAVGGEHSVIYLMGSVHLGKAPLRFGSAIEAAYRESDELLVEVDLTLVSEEDVKAFTLSRGQLPGSQRLRDVVEPETFQRVEAYASERDMSIALLNSMKPWLVSFFVAGDQMELAGYSDEFGVDRYFLKKAMGRKPIVGIETLASQLDALNALPMATQDLMLRDALLRVEHYEHDTDAMIAGWSAGDEDRLSAIVFSSQDVQPGFEPFFETVFYRRNEIMAERLVALAKDRKTRFAVIGAGHLVGPRGIPALLAAWGFHVERVDTRVP